MNNRIFIAEPVLDGNEKKYLDDCIDTAWLTWAGRYVGEFEKQFAAFCGTKYAIACANGTVSLHLPLVALGIGKDDEVIVPTFTYIASANVVKYCGATPVFVDCDAGSWNMDVKKIEAAVTHRTKAIMPVHLYGLICDMNPILELADKYGLYVIEDAAEAHGAEYCGKKSGSFGIANSFSLFGNKIITCGEGGVVTTNDEELYQKMRFYRGQGQDPNKRYWFTDIGYNYRMTNLQAAVALAQLENIDRHIQMRRDVAGMYREFLVDYIKDGAFSEQAVDTEHKHVYWMYSVLINNGTDRDALMEKMNADNIETRPLFYPLHTMPPYNAGQRFKVSEDISAKGLNLPSHGNLSRDDIKRVCESLIKHCGL